MSKRSTDLNPALSVLVITLGFILIGKWLDSEMTQWVGISVGLIGLLHTSIRKWIHLGWFAIGEILGRITSTIILSVVYCVLLVPIALLSRLLRKKNPMLLKNQGDSLFTMTGSTYSREDLVEQW